MTRARHGGRLMNVVSRALLRPRVRLQLSSRWLELACELRRASSSSGQGENWWPARSPKYRTTSLTASSSWRRRKRQRKRSSGRGRESQLRTSPGAGEPGSIRVPSHAGGNRRARAPPDHRICARCGAPRHLPRLRDPGGCAPAQDAAGHPPGTSVRVECKRTARGTTTGSRAPRRLPGHGRIHGRSGINWPDQGGGSRAGGGNAHRYGKRAPFGPGHPDPEFNPGPTPEARTPAVIRTLAGDPRGGGDPLDPSSAIMRCRPHGGITLMKTVARTLEDARAATRPHVRATAAGSLRNPRARMSPT